MPVRRVTTRVPTAIGRIEVDLVDPTGIVAERYVTVTATVNDHLGVPLENVSGDITAAIPSSIRLTLSNAMTQLRDYLSANILPLP